MTCLLIGVVQSDQKRQKNVLNIVNLHTSMREHPQALFPTCSLSPLFPTPSPAKQSHRTTYDYLHGSLLFHASVPFAFAQLDFSAWNALPLILHLYPLLAGCLKNLTHSSRPSSKGSPLSNPLGLTQPESTTPPPTPSITHCTSSDCQHVFHHLALRLLLHHSFKAAI